MLKMKASVLFVEVGLTLFEDRVSVAGVISAPLLANSAHMISYLLVPAL